MTKGNEFEGRILDELFDGVLKPLHSKNARKIYEIFYQNREFKYITTHDIEMHLVKQGLSMNKKEINGWVVSLQEANLVEKMESRGKPVASSYDDKYTFDLWRLTRTGLIVGERILNLMTEDERGFLPHLRDLTPFLIGELEDLYITSKLVVTLNEYGGSMNYVDLRKRLCIDSEKLAVYSWPDVSHSKVPLFEVKAKPPTLKGRIYKLFGWLSEQDLTFTLTEEGRKVAEGILSREPS